MFEGLLRRHVPEAARALKAKGGIEHQLTEAAVMLAFAMHLLRTVPNLGHVAIHPDGEHAKHFDFVDWLKNQGFARESALGKTAYGGLYRSATGQTIIVNPKSSLGDVLAEIEGKSYVAECKGGVINSKHAGQLSRLRKGLCEAIGLSMVVDRVEGRRQFAVVPDTPTTSGLARKMAKRAADAGIEIALVDGIGRVEILHVI